MRPPERRVVFAAFAALAALAALPFLGRWEQHRNARIQNERMAAEYRLATGDGLISRRLTFYRLATTFDCLDYAPRGQASATAGLELCFDRQGRLVQTVDRRTGSPHFASLQEQPSLATVHVRVPRLIAAFVRAGLFRRDPRLAGLRPSPDELPVGFDDIGAFPVYSH